MTSLARPGIQFFLISALAGLLGPALLDGGVAEAATFTVNYALSDDPDASPGDGICDIDFTPPEQCSVRAAIEEANASGPGSHTVEIPARPNNDSYQMAYAPRTLLIDRSVTIIGLGDEPVPIEVTSFEEAPFFEFREYPFSGFSTKVLENLSLRGSLTDPDSGEASALQCFGDFLTLRDVEITGNSGWAALAAKDACDLTLERVRVVDNDAAGIVASGSSSMFPVRIDMWDSTVAGNVSQSGGLGGALTTNKAVVVARDSTFSGNSTPVAGGGIRGRDDSEIRLTNSTIHGNSADESGGGFLVDGALYELRNVTVAANVADADGDGNGTGGGFAFGSGVASLASSIVADNHVDGVAEDCDQFSSFGAVSEGYNLVENPSADCTLAEQSNPGTDLVGLDPQLGPLGNNLGPTETAVPAGTSPAVDGGNPSGCHWDHDGDGGTPEIPLEDDQRGFNRPIDGDGDANAVCDIGSVELQEEGFAVFCPENHDPVDSGDVLATVCSIASIGGFADRIDLSCGVPGARGTLPQCAVSPDSVIPPANGTVDVDVQVGTTGVSGDDYTIEVAASRASFPTATDSFEITVLEPDFTLWCEASYFVVPLGETRLATCQVGSSEGFQDPVDLSCEAVGIGCTVDPNQVTPPADGSASFILELDPSSSGVYSAEIQAVSGALQHTLTIEVDVPLFLDGFESGDASRWSSTSD